MKLRGMFLWVALIACVLTPIQASAEDAVVSGAEKAEVAGELLTNVMDLLLERFVGDEISPEYLYEAALRGIMDSLDPYSEYLSPDELEDLQNGFSGKMYGIGITLDSSDKNAPAIHTVLEGSPAEKAGIKTGDTLLEVNKKPVKGLSLEQILAIIGESDTVALKVQRGGETMEKSVKKQEISVNTVTTSSFDDLLNDVKKRDNSALRCIAISEFGNETDKEFGDAVAKLKEQGVKRVAIDLRGNPGGYADSVIKICNRIVPKGPIMFTIDKQGNKMEIKSTLEGQPFEKIVVLTDHGTASAAEVLASALQDSQAAVVVGETTYGKGVIQSLYPMPNGGALKFTTEEYLRRSGKKLNGIGVTPNIKEGMPDLITDAIELDADSYSEGVPAVRAALIYLGYKLNSPDSATYDANMKDAVKRFQKESDMEVNGELSATTLIKMNLAMYTLYNETDKPLEKAYQILREGL